MASTVTNSFDADKLHQPIVVAVKRVPRIPLGKDNSKVLDNHCLNNYTIGAKLVPIFAGVCTAEKEGRGAVHFTDTIFGNLSKGYVCLDWHTMIPSPLPPPPTTQLASPPSQHIP